MTSYAHTVTEHLRLTILRTLAEQNDYRLNASLIRDILRQLGFTLSKDQVRTELAWLEEQKLLSLEEVMGLTVAQISERGLDGASGTLHQPGVARPSPGSPLPRA